MERHVVVQAVCARRLPHVIFMQNSVQAEIFQLTLQVKKGTQTFVQG